MPNPVFSQMKKELKRLYYRGDSTLLTRPKVSIVGSRRPSSYTRQYTYDIARSLASRGVVVVSGAAMGVDAISHQGSGSANAIAVLPTGIDVHYPATNAKLIEDIEDDGLTISQFEPGFRATPWSFVLRNEVVVALGEVLVVAEANIDSGSMRSVEFALQMGKEIYVLPHRLGESMGTNDLLGKGLAKPIYDIDLFASRFGVATDPQLPKDEFYYFCQKHPTFDEVIDRFGDRVYEAELTGIITVEDGMVRLN